MEQNKTLLLVMSSFFVCDFLFVFLQQLYLTLTLKIWTDWSKHVTQEQNNSQKKNNEIGCWNSCQEQTRLALLFSFLSLPLCRFLSLQLKCGLTETF